MKKEERRGAGLKEPSEFGYDPAMKCPIHGIPLVCYCPACRGGVRSQLKAEAARKNGKLGGRPKGTRAKKQVKKRGR
jgi:hypothetical protein